MYLLNVINSIYDTNSFISLNYITILSLSSQPRLFENTFLINLEAKSVYLWFPWASFFNYTTVFGIIYLLTILSIYNSDNTYYIVLYTIFLIFLISSTLITLDLDIFAGILLLLESVVILMLFFLIIYLTPNIIINIKSNKLKTYLLFVGLLFIISLYLYPNLSSYFFNLGMIALYCYDDYYEALNEVNSNDLMGMFTGFYITDSIVLIIIGMILLIASVICVVLVSFFTKLRNYSFKSFLNIFSILKTCSSFIFLRKQNLSKQGKSHASSRIFNKQSFDSSAHTEYREKYDIFEQKKKNEKKTTNII